MKKKNIYDENSIKILNSLEAIRKRPDMYIGNTKDGYGLHHLIFEVIDNSIDEFLSGFCNLIKIKIYKDNSISVYDNGRGIPVNIKKDDNNIPLRSAAEIVMTELHSGGKFNNKSYKISSGLHGVGLSCLNALCKKIKLIIYNNKKKYYLKFKKGILQNRKIYIKDNIKYSKLKIIGNTKKKGTKIKF
uniref:Histidine kinase/HSP90-like ATPase domain-containing protein n=1 Tax=Clastoptera arizonana TaxID=38151 RepID=A0A1B6CJA1_9HEMI